MTRFVLLAACAVVAVPGAAVAANARHPYSNVDPRVDAGNNTGDAQVEALNQQQLNRNAGPGPAGVYGPGQRIYSYVPPPAYGYAPPPVVYAPPPVVYAPYYPPYRYYRPYYPY